MKRKQLETTTLQVFQKKENTPNARIHLHLSAFCQKNPTETENRQPQASGR